MSKRFLSISSILLFALSTLLAMLYWQEKAERDALMVQNALMGSQVAESEEKQRDAVIQRRISEQLENIAREQKNLTEEQTRFAIEQRSIAEARQAEAVRQRLKADAATKQAVNALGEAESQRQIAVEQKDIAESERLKSEAAEKRANRLRQLALSQTLSVQASSEYEAGNVELAVMLATMGWNYVVQNGGDKYQTDLFKALKKTSGEDTEFRGHSDDIRGIAATRIKERDMLVTISQNGEIYRWLAGEGNFESEAIYQNKEYDFREIAINQDAGYLAAGDAQGVILIVKDPSGIAEATPFNLTSTPITGLYFIDNNTLIYTDSRGVVGRISMSEGFPYEYVYQHPAAIRAMAPGNEPGELIIADAENNVLALKRSGGTATPLLKVNSVVGAIAMGMGGLVAVGSEDGKITLFDINSAERSELVGHLSMVNDLCFSDKTLVSISYDQSIRLWNFDRTSTESILLNTLDQWGYGLALLPDGLRVASVGADRTIRIDTIDPAVLAEKVRARVNRNFSQEEWIQFIGEGNPYQIIMDNQ